MRKDLLLLAVGRLSQALLTIASLRLMTALLSPAQVGSMYLMLSISSWFTLFLIHPVGMYFNRNLHEWHHNRTLLERFNAFNVYVLIASLLFLPLIFLGKYFLGIGADIPLLHFIAVVTLYTCAFTWSQTPVQALNMLGNRGAFVGLSVLTVALGLLFSVLLTFIAGKTAYSWLYGQVFAFFAVYIPSRLKIKALGGKAGDGSSRYNLPAASEMKSLWKFSAPLAIAMFFMWMQTQSYRVIVEKFAGAEFLGYLAVGLSIATGLAGITESLVQQLYFPDFYKKLHGADLAARTAALSDLARKTIPVYVMLALFTFFMAQHLTRLLVSPQFHPAWKFALVGAVIELFRMVSNIFTAAAHSEMKTSALIWPYFWGGLFTSTAVFAACVSEVSRVFIPVAMALGGLLTMILVKLRMKVLAGFQIDPAPILKSLVLCLLFLPAFFVDMQESLLNTFAIVGFFGLCFVFAQWQILSIVNDQKGVSAEFGGIRSLAKRMLSLAPFLSRSYAAFKGGQQERFAAREGELYAAEAKRIRLPAPPADIHAAIVERLKARNVVVSGRPKGKIHVFLAYSRNNWEAVLEAALKPFGRLTVYEWKSRGYNDSSPDWVLNRDAMNADMLNEYLRADAERKVDVVVGYLTGYNTAPAVLEKMGERGAVVINFCWDDKLHFRDFTLGGRYAGPSILAKSVDLNLTCAPDSVIKYRIEGGLGMFWPEAAQPDIHKPYDVPFVHDVSFVGQKYGWRPDFIRNLRNLGIKVACFGNGWENGPLTDEGMVKLYSSSRINLGFAGIGFSKKLMGLKGRDFEVPMSGGLYLTQHNPELASVYKIGEEILTYRDEQDCAKTIKAILSDPARAEQIRLAGRARALRDHTWEKRFEDAFRISGIMR